MTIHLNHKDEVARRIASAVCYSGQKIKVKVVPNDHTFELRSGWSGGSRDTHSILQLDGMKCIDISNMPVVGNQFNRDSQGFTLPEGFAVVTRTMYSGTDLGITVSLLQANATALIAAPVELTKNERIVLAATRSLISRARRENANLPDQVWDATSAALISRGLLAKNKSITPEGRNAIGSMDLRQAQLS
jgi:hypothetical protein